MLLRELMRQSSTVEFHKDLNDIERQADAAASSSTQPEPASSATAADDAV